MAMNKMWAIKCIFGFSFLVWGYLPSSKVFTNKNDILLSSNKISFKISQLALV